MTCILLCSFYHLPQPRFWELLWLQMCCFSVNKWHCTYCSKYQWCFHWKIHLTGKRRGMHLQNQYKKEGNRSYKIMPAKVSIQRSIEFILSAQTFWGPASLQKCSYTLLFIKNYFLALLRKNHGGFHFTISFVYLKLVYFPYTLFPFEGGKKILFVSSA